MKRLYLLTFLIMGLIATVANSTQFFTTNKEQVLNIVPFDKYCEKKVQFATSVWHLAEQKQRSEEQILALIAAQQKTKDKVQHHIYVEHQRIVRHVYRHPKLELQKLQEDEMTYCYNSGY